MIALLLMGAVATTLPFSLIMPARWFIVIAKNIMLKGTGMAFVWKETLILLGMTIFFIVNAVRRFKTRLE